MSAEPLEAAGSGSEPESAGAAPRGRARLDDRLNPILIKEVRQSLRGRYFRILFWFTLVAATLTGVAMVASAVADGRTEDLGGQFFVSMWFILCAAVHGFVPFSAYVSTGAEWEENTFDLLVLSNLRPRQLVLGKLLSAVLQAMLFYSAFAPFLVFAFLMNGIDLAVIGFLLAGSVLLCSSLSLVAIALSSLARPKFARVIMMAALAALLVFVSFGSFMFGFFLVEEPEALRQPETLQAFLTMFAAIAAVGLFSLAIACARMAHAEENTASGLRAMTLALGLFAVLWGGWFLRELGEEEGIMFAVLMAIGVGFVPNLFFVTESEALGRRARAHVPRNRVLALLAVPFLPGGGRGALFLLLYAALIMVSSVLVVVSDTFNPTHKNVSDELTVIAAALGYLWFYLALPAGLGSFRKLDFKGRVVLRIAIPLAVLLSFFLPSLVGLFLDVKSWMEFEHPFFPFYTLEQLSRGRGSRVAFSLVVLGAGAVLAVAINLPRLVRGLFEVAEARADRVRREAPPPAPSTPSAAPDAVPES